MKDNKAWEWLGKNQLSYDIWNNKYRNNNESFNAWLNRVSGGDLKVRKCIEEKKFLFGGRILANRGISDKGSMSNCYSRGFVEDSIDGIYDANKDLAKTFKAEGGQGVSLSKIRPEGCTIKGKHTSDGIIPFMKVFDTTVGSISQGNSRRGALLQSLDIWHKEASNFIKIKSDLKAINNANLSLEIDDDFMQIISDYYNGKYKSSPIVHKIKEYDGNTIEYDVDIIGLYKQLCEHACKYAEPGILYVNPYREYILQQYHLDYKIETGNACSEQSLPKHGACNLMSFNLLAYVVNPFTKDADFNIASFIEDIQIAVKAMDDIIDENMPNHPLKEQAEISRKYRNIGIGYMGLADALIALGLKYGSEEAVKFTHNITKCLFREAVKCSIELAHELGSFPEYNNCVWESDIIKNNFTEDEIELLKIDNCLRHAEILSIAPTGSISTMIGVSGGIEPEFMLKYKRRTVSLNKEEKIYEVNAKIVDDYIKTTGNTGELPDYFITSHDIHWKDRIAMQAAAQQCVDTAISSTCNLPKTTTPEEVEQIYLEAWKNKLKGFTIYVDGSRDSVLFNENSIKSTGITTTKAPKRPEVLEADFYTIKYKGDQFTVVVGLLEGKPYEIFAYQNNLEVNIKDHKGTITKIGKNHYKFTSEHITIKNLLLEFNNVEEKAATLYPSQLLRHGVEIKYIIKTMKKVNENIASFTSAICRVLSKYTPKEVTKETCPECGEKLIMEQGCCKCMNCGFSRCG